MIRVLLAGLAAALLLGGGARAGEGAPARAPAGASEPTPPVAPASAPERARAVPAPERPRVAPGVLVRATRGQKRETSPANGAERPRRAAEGTIESIEIDWNAPAATP